MSILQTTELKKYYGAKPNITRALDGVTLSIEKGEFVAIVGTSGSGKSTLLNMIGGLDVPTSGKVIVDGRELSTLKDEQLTIFRRRKIGFIFQNYNLVPVLNVYENIVLPVELDGNKVDKKFMKEVVQMLGLEDKLNNMPNNLSGGQQQRVAIARALATDPKVLLCDEATSALDPKTTRQILELIRDINQKLNITVVIITHQMSVVKEVCSHVAILDDGCVAESGMVGTVFAAPKSEAGRRLVFPGGADAQVYNPQDEKLVRLVFKDSKTTSIPLIARLAAEEGVFCNVISASTQKLSETVYGSMMLGIPSAQYDKAVAFIHNVANVQVEEVDHHVQ